MSKICILIRKENDVVRNKFYIDAVLKLGGQVLLIYDSDSIELINNKLMDVDGILLTGGDDVTDLDLYLVNYAINNNLKLFGICLGMQAMSLSKLESIGNNSHGSGFHEVSISSSRLRDIVGKDKILVNSHHFERITNSNYFRAIGYANDGIIEAIENSNHPFQIGVQWHPERMIEYDDISKKLFQNFVN